MKKAEKFPVGSRVHVNAHGFTGEVGTVMEVRPPAPGFITPTYVLNMGGTIVYYGPYALSPATDSEGR